jgi:endonuclease/exonuclease/phosphatase family metal-dependent hydrolase
VADQPQSTETRQTRVLLLATLGEGSRERFHDQVKKHRATLLDARTASYAPQSVSPVGHAEVVVVSFNAHSGVDGWGRGFDVVEVCRSFEADVIVLQESWKPDGRVSMAEVIADELGYEVAELATHAGRLSGPHPHPDPHWKPRSLRLDGPRVVLPDRTRAAAKTATSTTSPVWPDNRRWPHGAVSERGTWSVAVLSRFPVASTYAMDLGQLRYDSGRRGALQVNLTTKAGPVAVVGTHMSHISRGSPIQFRRLRKFLAGIPIPAVLAGDMNLWGPPLVAQMPGWHRAVKGRTWPAWRPHSQPDHILVRPPIKVLRSEVLDPSGSDHRAIRARLMIP